MFVKQFLSPTLKRLDGGLYSGGMPDFIGIGLPKAGTSWLYDMLVEHPDIAHNSTNIKETCFFCHTWRDTLSPELLSSYYSYFGRADGKICGEWSTLYFHYPFVLETIKREMPNVKIMLCLRDPLSQFVSNLNQLRSKRARDFNFNDVQSEYVFDNLSVFPEVFNGVFRLKERLEELYGLFSEDNILVLQYEKILLNPTLEIRRMYQFLGVNADFVPESISVRRNESVSGYQNNIEISDQISDFILEKSTGIGEICSDIDESLWGKGR